MSALGQKQAYAVQKGMSLHPKADIRERTSLRLEADVDAVAS